MATVIRLWLSLLGSMEKHQEEFLNTMIELCKKGSNDWYRVYLIRKICSLQGVETARGMQKEAKFHWLFPEEIIQQVGIIIPIMYHTYIQHIPYIMYMWKLLNQF